MPTAYFYARVSSIDQAEHGHSMKDQAIRLKRCYRTSGLKREGFTRGPLLRDRGVSAYKHMLFARGDGQKLQMKSKSPMGLLEPGDAVVVDRLDRAFRNSRDFANTIHYWESHDVRVIFREFSHSGLPRIYERMLLQMLASFAELDSAIKSERIRERVALARTKGQPLGNAPLGFVIKRGKKGRNNRLVPDWRLRKVMAMMLTLADNGMKHEDIKKRVLAAHEVYCRSLRPKLFTARQTEIVDLIELHGRKWNKVAGILGLSKSTVVRIYKSAMKKLPPPPVEPGLCTAKISKLLILARKFREQGVLECKPIEVKKASQRETR